MFSIMLFIFFCFLGIAALCWHMLRTQEKHFLQLREEQARLAALLAQLHMPEAQLGAAGADSAGLAASKPVAASESQTVLPPETGPARLSLDNGPSLAAPVAASATAADRALELRFDTLPPPREQGDR